MQAVWTICPRTACPLSGRHQQRGRNRTPSLAWHPIDPEKSPAGTTKPGCELVGTTVEYLESGARIAGARRLVIKIGSALLVDERSGKLRADWLSTIADDVRRCHDRGQQVLIVSSGAIALGRELLHFPRRSLRLDEKQAAAAVGQIRLARAYVEALGRHDLEVAQILLTPEDTERRERHLRARATIERLLAFGVVPVINENDTVATDEIRFGDNDRLAARVAQMVNADTLILLSDIDGLYTADPRRDSAARHIPIVERLTADIEAMAGAAPPGYSSGGMVTKLAAAKIATEAGCPMVIARGSDLHPVRSIEAGATATWFLASAQPRNARKRWIAGALEPSGAVIIDDGAAVALARGTSLLPSGILGIEGAFEAGDTIVIRSRDGRDIARGLASYSAPDVRAVAGHNSREIIELLGYESGAEIVHRSDLVLSSDHG